MCPQLRSMLNSQNKKKKKNREKGRIQGQQKVSGVHLLSASTSQSKDVAEHLFFCPLRINSRSQINITRAIPCRWLWCRLDWRCHHRSPSITWKQVPWRNQAITTNLYLLERDSLQKQNNETHHGQRAFWKRLPGVSANYYLQKNCLCTRANWKIKLVAMAMLFAP